MEERDPTQSLKSTSPESSATPAPDSTNTPTYLQHIKDKLEQVVKKANEVKHIKLETIFDTIQDANTIFAAERKTYDFVLNLNKLLITIIIVLLVLIISLFPLKEKEPYLVGFSNATQNFVHIEKANETITANDALTRSLIGAYIINRETINRFDDSDRYEVVREQSSQKVWKTFENIVSQESSVYGNENLERMVRIANITKVKNGYANAEVQISLFHLGTLQSQKRYRISLMYRFESLDIDFKSLPKNPTGFQVTEYAVTEIATIKELNDENKVNPNSVQSRIKTKEKFKGGLDSAEFLQDNYQYKPSESLDSAYRGESGVNSGKDSANTNNGFAIPESKPTEFKTNNDEDLSSLNHHQIREKLNQDIKNIKAMQALKDKQAQKQTSSQKENTQQEVPTIPGNSATSPNSNQPNPFE